MTKSSQFPLKYELLFCLLITVVIAAIYGQVVNHEFVSFDDGLYIMDNPHVQNGLSRDGFKWAFGYQNKIETWHPLTWVLHMVNYDLFADKAGFHLLENVFWHMMNTCILFFLLHRMTFLFWPSVIVASMFAVHPMNVETVAWVSELKNLFSTFFWLLSMCAYVIYARTPNVIKYFLLIIVFTAGLLAKPMLVTLPFVFLLLDYWPLKRISSHFETTAKQQLFSTWITKQVLPRIQEKVPLICISITISYVVSQSLSELDNMALFSQVPLSLRVENLFVSYVSYLGKFVWPSNLIFFYPYPKTLSNYHVALSLLLLGSITFAFLVPLRKKKYLTVGWLWFLGTLIPVLGLVQAGLWPAMADRYAYVPFIGLYITCAWYVQEFCNRQKRNQSWLILVSVLIVLIFGVVSWHQVQHWRNSENLYKYALEVSPHHRVAHNNLGGLLTKKGQIDEAIKHFYMALDTEQTKSTEAARRNLIGLLRRQGKTEEANRVYEEGVRLAPNSFESNSNSPDFVVEQKGGDELVSSSVKHNLVLTKEADSYLQTARKLTSQGRIREAIENYLLVVKINPHNYESLNNLALLLDKTGDGDSAIMYFKKALQIVPQNDEINYNLAYSLSAKGLFTEAEKYFVKSLAINPSFIYAHINLGILLAQNGRPEEAIGHFAKALEIDPFSIDGHTNMGIIYYQLGRKSESIFHFQEAVKLHPENQNLQKMLREASR